MEVILGAFVLMTGIAVYDNINKEEVEKEVVELPAQEYFDYDMERTFYEDAYSLSFKAKKDKGSVLRTTNTVKTTVYSAEPQFHSFGFEDPDTGKMKEFKLQFQMLPIEDSLKANFFYRMEVSQKMDNGPMSYTNAIKIDDKIVINLYDENSKQYEDVFIEVNIEDIRDSEYYTAPEALKCHSDYCEILKENTKNLIK